MFVLLRKAAVWSVLLMSLMSRRALFNCWDLSGSLQQGGIVTADFFGISLLSFPPSALLKISGIETLVLGFYFFLKFLRSSMLTSWKWKERISFSASKLLRDLRLPLFSGLLGAIKGICLYSTPLSIWSAFKCNHICACWGLFYVSISFFF